MITIALFGSRHQDRHLTQLRIFLRKLLDHRESAHIVIEQRFFDYISPLIDLDWSLMEVTHRLVAPPDIALSIGGDGTFLRVAKMVGRFATPILGINTGHLGYLSAASIDDADSVIGDILSGNYTVEPRSIIKVTTDTGELSAPRFALNEVAVLRRDTASMINIDARLCGEPLASYRGDGLIISTPTGSTGYNLSVGGPIVAPSTPCWIIAPIAPHSLNMRPLVVPDTDSLVLRSSARSDTLLLSIDGKATVLPVDTVITVEKASFCINLLHRPGRTFVETIRTKLLWGTQQ